MRDFKNMKRQRGRNRGGGGGGGGKPQHNANRAFDSNGPDNVKIRGHAQHVFEKYQQLARDAFSSGDRVLAENYLQHADHYFRVLRTIQPQRSPSEIMGRDVLASGLDIDFEEEFEPGDEMAAEAAPDGAAEANGEGQRGGDGRAPAREDRFERNEGRRDGPDYRDGRREERYDSRRDYDSQQQPREARDGQYRDRAERQDRPDRGGERQGGERQDRGERFDRGDRPERPERFEGRRERRFEGGRREDRPFNRDGREPRYDDRRPSEVPGSGEQPGLSAPADLAPAYPASTEAETSPVLRSQDGAMSEAPAFLQAASGDDGEGRKPRPRRRRAPKSYEAGEGDGSDVSARPAPETEEA